ncbi:hypothetical protein Dimus_021972 [Dionaea muscipula]
MGRAYGGHKWRSSSLLFASSARSRLACHGRTPTSGEYEGATGHGHAELRRPADLGSTVSSAAELGARGGRAREEGREAEHLKPSSRAMKAEHGDGSIKVGDKLALEIRLLHGQSPWRPSSGRARRAPMEPRTARPSSGRPCMEARAHEGHAWSQSMS